MSDEKAISTVEHWQQYGEWVAAPNRRPLLNMKEIL